MKRFLERNWAVDYDAIVILFAALFLIAALVLYASAPLDLPPERFTRDECIQLVGKEGK